MKTVALRDAKQSLSGFVARSQRERVLITKHGRPAAVVIGVEGHDFEDVLVAEDPAFWRLIEQRRRQRTMSLADVKARLGVITKPTGRKRRARRSSGR